MEMDSNDQNSNHDAVKISGSFDSPLTMEASTAMSSDTMPRNSVLKSKPKIANDRDFRPEGAAAAAMPKTVVYAHVVSLRLLFTAWITHFRSLGYIKDTTMDMLDQTVLRRSIQISVRDTKAR